MSNGILVYALAWLVFAALHSWLARLSVQKVLEAYLGKAYRFTYNLIAVIQILLVYKIGGAVLTTSNFAVFDLSIPSFAGYMMQLCGIVVLAFALRAYDLGRFSGITQLLTGERLSDAQPEPLQVEGFNRHMRHPLYTGAFFILWGGATSQLGFWTAVFGTLYLIIGTLFEERKLIRLYGDEYIHYQQKVPRYFPRLRLSISFLN